MLFRSAFTDGKTVRPMATSQDHKRALEGDKGPNTGGMGVYSPVPIVTDEEHATMVAVMEQTVAELAAEGIDYRGCLYGGFMLTPAGPKVLEFNARFGDGDIGFCFIQLGARGVVILTANVVGLQQRCLAVKGDAGIAGGRERFRQRAFGGVQLGL